MKKFLSIICFVFCTIVIVAQNPREDFIKVSSDKYNSFKKEQKEAYKRFTDKQNEEYAKFIKESWQLYEDFNKQDSPFSEPKFKEAPVAPCADKIDLSLLRNAKDAVVDFIVKAFSLSTKKDNEVVPEEQTLPISNVKVPQSNDVITEELNLPMSDVQMSENNDVIASKEQTLPIVEVEKSIVEIDFYGEKLALNFSDCLKIQSIGLSEADVADYFRTISKFAKETSELWFEISVISDRFGLNDWGEFLLLKKISEQCFESVNDRVLFCFYMLRNEGMYKVKVARGGVSNNLVLMMALDNTKDVYEYGYFVFVEQDVKVKYYLTYGAGREEKTIYTYRQNQQDLQLAQVKLDFDKNLSIGTCDKVRELKVNSLNKTINLPFNSSNIAYLNDVPQTSFPIYFVSALPLDAQDVLGSYFGNLKNDYSIVEATGILLNFVQTSFNYKTDNDQFGYEKYFYPEEAIAYPFCDCEDRSALFGWLVRTYLGLPVIGLQYPGHLATAVCFGDDVNIEGTAFTYGGKKYYVCDPTYKYADVGMAMPEFKNVVPKVIKLKKM